MTLRALVLAVFAIAILLVSVIGWYALDFSLAVANLLMVPESVSATLMVLWGACVLSMAVLVAVLLRYFVRPLAQLRDGALAVAAGDYGVRLKVSAASEIGDLQDAFNVMAEGLAQRARTEERYRIVFDHANIGIVQATTDGIIVAANPAFAGMLGYSPAELAGRSWRDITHPDDHLRTGQEMQSLQSGHIRHFHLEKRYLRKDRGEVWAEVTVAQAIGPDGRTPCIIATANDITQRRQAEAARERTAADLAIFREMVNQSHDMLLVVDNETRRVLDANEAACRQLGYGRDELLSLRVDDFATELHEQVVERRLSAGRAPTGTVFEAVDRRKDGSTFPVEVSLRVVDTGTHSLSVAVVRDISERISREEQMRLLLDATEEGIYAVDTEGNCTLCNGAAARMLGYGSPDEIIGRNTHALLHHSRPDGGLYPEDQCPLRQALQERRIQRVGGEVFWRRNGTAFPVEYAIYPMVRDGAVIGAVVSFNDVSRKLSAEEALRHAQKMEALSSLTGGIAHEINNMLLPILTLAGLTMKEMPEDSRARTRLEKILDAATRARDLIERLNSFARHGDVDGQRRRLDVGGVVANAVALVRPTLPADVDFAEHYGDGAATAVVDGAAIETLAVNLISNAIDAMTAGGRLEVTVEPVDVTEDLRLRVPDLGERAYVRLRVADTGRGMDEDTVKRMFDPFFTTKEVGTGTGLGLAVVHGIVAAHGGAIAVASRPGHGTTVDVYLPAAE